MGEHVAQQNIERHQFNGKRRRRQTPQVIGRRLLDVVVYQKDCRIGDRLDLDVLSETSEVGGIRGGLQHQRWHGADENDLGDAL